MVRAGPLASARWPREWTPSRRAVVARDTRPGVRGRSRSSHSCQQGPATRGRRRWAQTLQSPTGAQQAAVGMSAALWSAVCLAALSTLASAAPERLPNIVFIL